MMDDVMAEMLELVILRKGGLHDWIRWSWRLYWGRIQKCSLWQLDCNTEWSSTYCACLQAFFFYSCVICTLKRVVDCVLDVNFFAVVMCLWLWMSAFWHVSIWGLGAVLCVCLSVRTICDWAKPCLRKMQAGPTMLWSTVQFWTRAHSGSSNSFSRPGLSSPSSSAPGPRTPPSIEAARGAPLPCWGSATVPLERDQAVTNQCSTQNYLLATQYVNQVVLSSYDILYLWAQ